MPVVIIVRPVGRGRFEATLGERILVESTRTPLLAAARILQGEGVPDDTPLAMRHAGSQIIAMRSTVGAAAGCTVSDKGTPRFVPYTGAVEGPMHMLLAPVDGDSSVEGTMGAE